MHLDQDLDVAADRLAHRRHDRLRAPAIGRRQLRARRAERIELERAIAPRDHVTREGCDCRRVALRLVPPVRVRRHARAKPSAEELPDRHAERLAHQIPARDVERRQGRLRHLAGASVLRALHVPREPLDVERIGADDIARRQLADAGDERLGLVDHADLADTGEAAIGGELQKSQIAPRSADNRRARGDGWCASWIVCV